MKTNFLKPLMLILTLIICQQNSLLATHIVGGEMNYECLGNDEYRISLKIYRDCYAGVPWFDNPVVIGVFDAQTNSFIHSISIFLDQNSNDTVNSYYPDSCISPSFCIHTTLYSTITTLPFTSSGYILSYQRCCRASTVVNLTDPNSAGMTLTTEITAAALLSCNSSPTFNREVPFILGINDTFSINLGATDINGDSLVYTFYAPFDGASIGNPLPSPPAMPPYSNVSYQSPYNSQMPLGNLACTWDSLNGDFIATPTALGNYIVGFSILEYNTAGVLLSTTYKDIAITVAPSPCPTTININKVATSSTIKIFPNPTKDNLTIETGSNQQTVLNVYSIQGQLLFTKSFREQTTLDLGEYPKGVYLLKFENDSEQIVKRFIKK
ncbi:MAG: T9SS type A sorting domain-containing protein [Aureispira sp.]|nr:T9SS type A sorting domain-containing protein [Aureispira sp.]